MIGKALDNLFVDLENIIDSNKGKKKIQEDPKILKLLNEKIQNFIQETNLSVFKKERLFSFLISKASAHCHEAEIFDEHDVGLYFYQMQCALVNVKMGKF